MSKLGVHSLSEIREALDHAKYLSLDVFDTALWRQTLTPRDLCRRLEADAMRAYGPELHGLAGARWEAERRTASTDQRYPSIYTELAEIFPSAAPHRSELAAAELKLESALLTANPWCLELFREAQAKSIPVLFLSDMYLPPDFIASVLEREGYTDYASLYVSAYHGVSKAEGTMFDRVIADLGIDPSDMLHVGDNIHADVDMARSRGLVARVMPTPRQFLADSARYTFLDEHGFRKRSLSFGDLLALGLSANEEYRYGSKEITPASEAERVGYQVLGPATVAFVSWLIERAKAANLDTLAFIGRDGFIFREAFDRMEAQLKTGLGAAYIRSSRVSLLLGRVVSMTAEELTRDVTAQVRKYGVEEVPLSFMGPFFGIPAEDLADAAREHLPSVDSTVHLENDLSTIQRVVQTCFPKLQEVAKEHLEAWRIYLRKAGLDGSKRIALVDNTTSGRTYLRLRESLNTALDYIEVQGLYLYIPGETLELVSPREPVYGWLFDFRDQGLDPELDYVIKGTCEDLLLSAPEDSVLHFRLENGEPRIVEAATGEAASYDALIGHVHRGALRYVDDHVRLSESVGASQPSHALSQVSMERLCRNPTAAEGRLYQRRVVDRVALVPTFRAQRLFTQPRAVWAEMRDPSWRPGLKATLPPTVVSLARALRSLKAKVKPS